MKTYLEQYWDLITSGEVIVGQWLRMEVQNLITDLKDDRYIYMTQQKHINVSDFKKVYVCKVKHRSI